MKNIYNTVIEILIAEPRTRNSDRLLTEAYYARMGVDIGAPWFVVNRNKDLPSCESIGRTRRKAQEKYPELRADEPVAEFRGERIAEFREFSRI